ncbi:MAG: hypothetical protein P4L46_13175 [Fimbriimonas sp.]|nr:hypothetical protein [Fimbriimonas sp.]
MEPDQPTDFDFAALARRLESFHELFRVLWEVGRPVFTEQIETAAIAFDSKGAPLRFLFNPDFYRRLDPYSREFVVCHEMLHVVLNHGFRTIGLESDIAANIAADLVVNHLLVSRFGFRRELLIDWESACWVDTVFPLRGKLRPAADLTLEQYYELLLKQVDWHLMRLIDEHLFEPGPSGSLTSRRGSRELNAHLARVSPLLANEIKSLLGADGRSAQAGSETLGAWCQVNPVPPEKVPWEWLIRNRLGFKSADRITEGWVNPPRRLMAVEELVLPSPMPDPSAKVPKTQSCFFFLDTSGSCWDYKDRFFGLARSLMRAKFKVELCSFDTRVYRLDLAKTEVKGGGGTSFAAIEAWLRVRSLPSKRDTEPLPYPDVVIVLTDGVGDKVEPLFPERWHWLLTSNCVELVPKASVQYRLSEYL